MPELIDPGSSRPSRAGTTPGTPPRARSSISRSLDAERGRPRPRGLLRLAGQPAAVSLEEGLTGASLADDPLLVAPAGRNGRRPRPRHRAADAVAGVLRRAARVSPSSTSDRRPSARCSPTAAHPTDAGHRHRPTTRDSSPLDLEASRYEGPTGIVGVLHACVRARLPALAVGRRAALLSPPPSPKATLACCSRSRTPGVTCRSATSPRRRGPGSAASTSWPEDDEVAEYVRSLEEARDTADLPEANGDAIAREFERYLRRRGASGG